MKHLAIAALVGSLALMSAPPVAFAEGTTASESTEAGTSDEAMRGSADEATKDGASAEENRSEGDNNAVQGGTGNDQPQDDAGKEDVKTD